MTVSRRLSDEPDAARRARAVREHVLRSTARVSRALHGRGYVGDRSAAMVRLVARRLAAEGTYTYHDHHGHLMEADLADYMERAGFFGVHSPKLLRLLSSRLRPGDWVIDAGANVGLFASAFSATVGPQGRVWAVEPLPHNVERLRRLKQANDLTQLEILPFALGSAPSTARLRVPAAPGGSGFGSFVATWPTSGEIEVSTCRLDDLVEGVDPGRPLRLVKIDVEGFEGELVAGAARTLSTRRPLVLCEFHDPLLRAAGRSSQELLRQFERCGYAPLGAHESSPRSLDGRVVDLLLGPR